MPSLLFAFIAAGLHTHAAKPEDPKHALDFWLGSWEVRSSPDHVDGNDKVEVLLNGNAIMEHWRDVEGNEGKSFFYYMPAKKQWTQVWVTGAGVYKEKYSQPVPGGVRFAGHVFLSDGRSFDDRTTLTKLTNSRVHQVIESSRDKGKTWRTTYDAIYTKS